eukprot:1303919-Amphidinium_carterae.1
MVKWRKAAKTNGYGVMIIDVRRNLGKHLTQEIELVLLREVSHRTVEDVWTVWSGSRAPPETDEKVLTHKRTMTRNARVAVAWVLVRCRVARKV